MFGDPTTFNTLIHAQALGMHERWLVLEEPNACPRQLLVVALSCPPDRFGVRQRIRQQDPDIHAGARTVHHGTAQLGIGHEVWGGEVQGPPRRTEREPVQRPKRMGLGRWRAGHAQVVEDALGGGLDPLAVAAGKKAGPTRTSPVVFDHVCAKVACRLCARGPATRTMLSRHSSGLGRSPATCPRRPRRP